MSTYLISSRDDRFWHLWSVRRSHAHQVVGYALLNCFCVAKAQYNHEQPQSLEDGVRCTLNEGAFQVPLFHYVADPMQNSVPVAACDDPSVSIYDPGATPPPE